jgi:hypothetical protein
MGEDVVTCIEVPIFVVPPSKDFLGVLDEIQRAEGVAQGILDGQSRSRNGVICVVVPGEGIPMRHSKKGHFKADESILNSGSKIVGVVAWDIVRNGS